MTLAVPVCLLNSKKKKKKKKSNSIGTSIFVKIRCESREKDVTLYNL